MGSMLNLSHVEMLPYLGNYAWALVKHMFQRSLGGAGIWEGMHTDGSLGAGVGVPADSERNLTRVRDRAERATEDLEPGLDARKGPGHESRNLNQYVSNFSVPQISPFRREVGSEPENGTYSSGGDGAKASATKLPCPTQRSTTRHSLCN